MFGIREFLKRNFSIEAMTTAVERKIANDMAADPMHPRNAVGVEMIASIQSVREQAIARRELETLVPAYNRRANAAMKARHDFQRHTPEWQARHPEVLAQIDRESQALNEEAERIKTLIEIAQVDLTCVSVKVQ